MRHRHFSILIAILAVLLAGFLLGRYVFPERVIVRESVAKNEAAERSVNLMLSYGNGIVRTWNTIIIAESTSVLDLLRTVAGTGAIALETEELEGKTRIKSIDAVGNSPEEGRRWKFWINNVEEPRAIDRAFLRPGDIVVVALAKE